MEGGATAAAPQKARPRTQPRGQRANHAGGTAEDGDGRGDAGASEGMTTMDSATKRPLLLDLFCGAGGAAMGYHRAGFDVLGVDIAPQKRYPFSFVQADALEMLAWLIQSGDIRQFAAVHASPPCQEYSETRYFRKIHHVVNERAMLLEPTYAALRSLGLPWVIENVARAPMPDAIVLCGTMFGLQTERHRAFASSHLIYAHGPCQHIGASYNVIGGKVRGYGAYSSGRVYTSADGTIRHRESYPRKATGQAALGIDWMTIAEMSEAIPPAYTEWIGRQLLSVIANTTTAA